tara:strand:+ start:6357 stop:7058 length:702 start_codon:yes stop_codon:yes gene_type:complete
LEDYKVKYYTYDTKKYPFVKLMRDLFNIDSLNNIHNLLDNKVSKELFTNENDDTTILHNIFYKKLNSDWVEFNEVYLKFIKKVMTDVFSETSIIYQAKPTFRVQLPNNIAVGGNTKDSNDKYGWHKDTDDEYNHPTFEKNFIIPLTDSDETASVYIETYPNSDEFKAAKMRVGEFFQFRGGECIHGNKPNKTGKSRVSLDFRLVLKSDYNKDYEKISKLSSKKFVIGDYYNEL